MVPDELVHANQMRALETELNSALAQLAEKDKEIAMLRDLLQELVGDLESMANIPNLPKGAEEACLMLKEFLRRERAIHPLPYIHTDKVKPLVEALESVKSDICTTMYRLSLPTEYQVERVLAHYKQLTEEE